MSFILCKLLSRSSIKHSLSLDSNQLLVYTSGRLFKRGMQVMVTVDIPKRGIQKGMYVLKALKKSTEGKLEDQKGKVYNISQNDSKKIFPTLEVP